MIPALYKHQEHTADYITKRFGTLVTSDTGTGKTRAVLEAFRRLKTAGEVEHLYVIAPLTILQPAWGNDIERWTPELTYAVCESKNREEKFSEHVDIYITNHDAVKWMEKNPDVISNESMLCIDEITAFKHHTSQRSKAIRKIRERFKYRVGMSGTINSNTITDIWHPMFLIDDGERLGRQFYGFRSQVCAPQQVGPDPRMVKWVDKPAAEDMVAAMLKDVTIRYKFEDCISIPKHTVHDIFIDLPFKLLKQYNKLLETATLELDNGDIIDAIHAGAKVKKMLQLITGAVYNDQHVANVVHTARYELVIELINEREQCVVAFNWRHERENLVNLAKKEKWDFAVIDGSTSNDNRIKAVEDFQEGKIKVIFAHPASAAHGLTLTAGRSTIWASPTYNAEHFKQFNARIYRAGQSNATETIRIAANETKEIEVYEALDNKLEKMSNLMGVFTALTDLEVLKR